MKTKKAIYNSEIRQKTCVPQNYRCNKIHKIIWLHRYKRIMLTGRRIDTAALCDCHILRICRLLTLTQHPEYLSLNNFDVCTNIRRFNN